MVDGALIERLNQSALTVADLENIVAAKAVQPSRCFEYISERHQKQGRDGTLWREFPPVVPFSIIDPRIMDLARDFWDRPDSNLSIGYRRLEDLVRERTGLTKSSAKLFSRAFTGEDAVLTWMVKDESEKQGRAGLFVNVYLAYRNPRAHQENPKAELLAEFLLLNHLYLLEAEAVPSGAAPKAEDSA